MPEYLAPGVFVEETSSRQKSIEGVSTSTTAFVGPTRFGPEEGEPPLLTSFAEFERIYGGLDQLEYDGEAPSHNYVAHAVRAYFEEGGKRLYVARTTGNGACRSVSETLENLVITARHVGAAGGAGTGEAPGHSVSGVGTPLPRLRQGREETEA